MLNEDDFEKLQTHSSSSSSSSSDDEGYSIENDMKIPIPKSDSHLKEEWGMGNANKHYTVKVMGGTTRFRKESAPLDFHPSDKAAFVTPEKAIPRSVEVEENHLNVAEDEPQEIQEEQEESPEKSGRPSKNAASSRKHLHKNEKSKTKKLKD